MGAKNLKGDNALCARGHIIISFKKNFNSLDSILMNKFKSRYVLIFNKFFCIFFHCSHIWDRFGKWPGHIQSSGRLLRPALLTGQQWYGKNTVRIINSILLNFFQYLYSIYYIFLNIYIFCGYRFSQPT